MLGAALVLGCEKYTVGPQSPVPAPPAISILPPEIVDTTWEWVGFTSPVEQLTIDAASNYTIRFLRDGRLSVRADCNHGMTQYSVSAERGITIQPIALTRVACSPGSLSDRFVKELEQVRIYFTRDGDFFLEKAMDSGTLRFRR
jgi:heat shock protein HslJ